MKRRTLMLAYVNLLTGRHAQRQMPLGPRMVSAAAKEAGWDVCGRYWGSELTVREFQADLDRTLPDLVGYYTDMLNVHALGHLLERIRPPDGTLTVLGGPEATFNPEAVMERCPADLLVRGDGEPVIAELLNGDFRDPAFLASVPGLSYRRDGTVRHNPDRPPGDGNGDLAPDRELAPQESEALHVITARGCKQRCAFCSESTLTYRPRPTESVRDELTAAVARRRPGWIVILDDTFSANVRRAEEIGALLGEVYGGPWSCEVAAADIDRHPDLARHLAEAGLRRVQIGIESGNDETLRVYGKRMTRASLERTIEILLDGGVEAVYGNFIVGAPGETTDMVRANIDFARALIRRYPGQIELSASILAHNPGAPFFERPEEFGLHFTQETLNGALAYRSSACSTQYLNAREIEDLHRAFSTEIHQEVRATLKELSPEEIRRQLYYNDVGFTTPWNKALLGIQHIAKHYQYVKYEGSHLDLNDLDEGGLADAIPQRTKLEVNLSVDGSVVLSGLSGKVRQLNRTASFLDEIACGQLTIREIARLVHERIPGGHRPSFDRVLADTMGFYERLAAEMYIAFVIP